MSCRRCGCAHRCATAMPLAAFYGCLPPSLHPPLPLHSDCGGTPSWSRSCPSNPRTRAAWLTTSRTPPPTWRGGAAGQGRASGELAHGRQLRPMRRRAMHRQRVRRPALQRAADAMACLAHATPAAAAAAAWLPISPLQRQAVVHRCPHRHGLPLRCGQQGGCSRCAAPTHAHVLAHAHASGLQASIALCPEHPHAVLSPDLRPQPRSTRCACKTRSSWSSTAASTCSRVSCPGQLLRHPKWPGAGVALRRRGARAAPQLAAAFSAP